jgi:hypothetical protein
MTQDKLIEKMAQAINDVRGPMGFSYEQFCAAAASEAYAALRKALEPVGWAYERRAFRPALSQREPEYPDLLWKAQVYILEQSHD